MPFSSLRSGSAGSRFRGRSRATPRGPQPRWSGSWKDCVTSRLRSSVLHQGAGAGAGHGRLELLLDSADAAVGELLRGAEGLQLFQARSERASRRLRRSDRSDGPHLPNAPPHHAVSSAYAWSSAPRRCVPPSRGRTTISVQERMRSGTEHSRTSPPPASHTSATTWSRPSTALRGARPTPARRRRSIFTRPAGSPSARGSRDSS